MFRWWKYNENMDQKGITEHTVGRQVSSVLAVLGLTAEPNSRVGSLTPLHQLPLGASAYCWFGWVTIMSAYPFTDVSLVCNSYNLDTGHLHD